MHRSKRGPALFEVLNKDPRQSTETPKVPPWGRGQQGPAATDPIKLGADAEKGGPVEMNRAGPDESDRHIPFVELDGGRIRVSFSSTTAAFAVFVGMAIVLGAFELGNRRGYEDGIRVGHEAGRASYAAEAVSEIEEARRRPPATDLVSGLLADSPRATAELDESSEGATSDAEETTWIRSYTYIVAQEFAANRAEDAQHARRFLAERGITTAAVGLPSGAIQLITTEGYNHKDPTQKRIAEQLLEKERGIGAEYYASGGGYRLNGYFKTLKDDRW